MTTLKELMGSVDAQAKELSELVKKVDFADAIGLGGLPLEFFRTVDGSREQELYDIHIATPNQNAYYDEHRDDEPYYD